jgi:Rab-GTPase-TBC domain
VDQKAFDALLRQLLPKLQAKFDALSFPVECVTMKWFMGVFVHSGLPTETLMFLWDLFIFFGRPSVREVHVFAPALRCSSSCLFMLAFVMVMYLFCFPLRRCGHSF